MIQKLLKLIIHPKKYMSLAIKTVTCSSFQNSSIFLQNQMDINPKSNNLKEEIVKLTGGFYIKNDNQERQICNLSPWDNTRRDMMILLLRTLVEQNIVGDMAELGVYRGHTAKLIHYYVPERKFYLFDTFEGFTDKSVISEKRNTDSVISGSEFANTSIDRVKRYISPKNDNVLFYKGYFPESIPEQMSKNKFSFVHIDADLFEPTLEGLKFFYHRMNNKGFIVIHDYNAWLGARKAVDEFFKDKIEFPIPMPDKSGSAFIVKQ